MDLGAIIDLQKLKTGTSCLIYKASVATESAPINVVIKIGKVDIENDILGEAIKNSFLEVRDKVLRSGVNVPYLYKSDVVNGEELPDIFRIRNQKRFMIVEDYAGESVKEIIAGTNYSKTEKEGILSNVKEFILKLPEDVPLDTNSGNIVYCRDDGKLSFIDFIPPDPWLYETKPDLKEGLLRVFPSLVTLLPDEEGKKRYFLNQYRVAKFNYYINKDSIPS